jgi:hypothetical protein
MRFEYRTVPAEKVLGRQSQFVIALSGRHVGDTPMRRLSLAVDTKGCRFGLHDEAVVLQLAIPVRYVAPVLVTEFLPHVTLAQVDVAIVTNAARPQRCE